MCGDELHCFVFVGFVLNKELAYLIERMVMRSSLALTAVHLTKAPHNNFQCIMSIRFIGNSIK